ncbi:hypothetical protein EW026_g7489 [Hermanssonia centrifuga]|uniref:Uncharacterized protein n=1 Tax=Hermanssonia centrifuga TaxID=98765 RepID=A0A4S4K9F0_9APHY|nr:hypothetical protein EW026_g7489 [Hermanssonia centrifuga]
MLLRKRSSTVKRSNSILCMLMIYGVSTGALTGVCALMALMALMAYAAFGNTLIFAGLLFVLQKCAYNMTSPTDS